MEWNHDVDGTGCRCSATSAYECTCSPAQLDQMWDDTVWETIGKGSTPYSEGVSREEVEIDGSIWVVEIYKGECKIFDPGGQVVHHSNGHKSTAVHFAMALGGLRQRRLDMRSLVKKYAESAE